MPRKAPSRIRTAEATFPNAGVENRYRTTLQTLVHQMAQELFRAIQGAWHEGGGIATDRAPRDGVGVVFRDDRGWVLLLRRADGSGWGWPGGGVEPGETHLQAAHRECIEEMGGRVYWLPFPSSTAPQVINVQGGPVRYVTVLVDVGRAFAPVLNHEHDDWMWVRPDVAVFRPDLFPGISSTLLVSGLADIPLIDVLAHDAKKMGGARSKPSTPKLLDTAMKKWGVQWNKKATTASEQLARAFATNAKAATEAAMKAKLLKAGFAVKFKPSKVTTAALDAVVAENVGLIRTIPQKFLGDVQNSVWQAVMQGSDLATLTKELHEKYGIAWRRAEFIALDQNAKAKAAIERARRLDVGITKAVWCHSHAGKDKRPTHVKAGKDKTVYDVKRGWFDPAVQKFIWPGTEPRCKCFDQPVIPGFE
jgi:8-oxo-dGTP pyrophosphatase MutT (NUDIX family)